MPIPHPIPSPRRRGSRAPGAVARPTTRHASAYPVLGALLSSIAIPVGAVASPFDPVPLPKPPVTAPAPLAPASADGANRSSVRYVELGLGIGYSRADSTTALRAERGRDVSVPLSLAVGLGRRVEASVAVTLERRTSERSTSGAVSARRADGIGDTTLGLSWQWLEGHAFWPDVSLSASATLPTGEPPAATDPLRPGTGSGHRRTGLALSVVKGSAPALLFGQLRYELIGARDDGLGEVRPGAVVSFGMGAGVSLNPKLSLSTQLRGRFRGDTRYDGRAISGTGSEGLSLGAGLDLLLHRRDRIEAAIDFGLGGSDSGAGFTIGYKRRFL